MNHDSGDLPEHPGAVIGYSAYYDTNHYMTAVLSQGSDLDADLVWWRSGFGDEKSHEEMSDLLRGHTWQYLGTVRDAR